MMKRISLFLVVLALVLSVGMVAAAEDVNSVDDSQVLLTTDDNAKIGNFTELQAYFDDPTRKEIDFKELGYAGFVRADGEDAISVTRNTVIEGHGGYVDANGGEYMFIIKNNNVLLGLQNVTLKNTNGTIIDVNNTEHFTINIDYSIFKNNTGLFVDKSDETIVIDIDKSLFIGNEIWIDNEGTLTMDKTVFTLNAANRHFGQINDMAIPIIENNGKATISDSLFIFNRGLIIKNQGNMTLFNSTITRNIGFKYSITENNNFTFVILNTDNGVLNMTLNKVIFNIANSAVWNFVEDHISNDGDVPTLILKNNTLGNPYMAFDIVDINGKIITEFNRTIANTYTHKNHEALIIATLTDDMGNDIYTNNMRITVINGTTNNITYKLNMTENVLNKYAKYSTYVALTNETIKLAEGTYKIRNSTATLTVYNETYKAQGNITVDAFNSYYSYNQYFNITLNIVPTIYALNNNIKIKIYREHKLINEFEISPIYLQFNYLVNVNKMIGKYLPISDGYSVFVSYEDEFNNISWDKDNFAVIDPAVKYDTNIDLNVSNILVGEEAYVQYYLDAKNPYKNMTIKLYKGAELIEQYSVEPNSTSLKIKDLEYGHYNIIATYDGDFFNKRANKVATFYVNKYNAKIDASVESVTEDENATVLIKLDANQPTGKMVIRVYELGIKIKEYEVPLNTTRFTLDNLGIGFYKVIVKFMGDDYNFDCKDTQYFTVKPVEKTKTNLTVTAEDVFEGEDVTANINFEAVNPSGNITINLYKGIFFIGSKEISPDTTKVIFTNLTTGNYRVVAYYAGDKYNTASRDVEYFAVKEIPKYDTDLEVETKSITEDETLYVDINLDAQNPTGDIVVSVYNGLFLINSTTVSADTKVVAFENLKAGTYHIYARYSGDKYNTPATDLEFFIVNPVPQVKTNLTVEAESITVGEDLVINIDFEAVNPTNNLTINVFDGLFLIKSFNVTPDTEFVTVENLTIGTYHVTARYAGDKYNTAAVDRAFFMVKPVEKIDTNLTVDVEKVITEGDDLLIQINMDEIETKEKLTVTVYDGLRVFNRYTVNAESQNITVYNLKAGIYHVVVSFPGDDEYYSASETEFLFVAKKENSTALVA